MWLVTVDGVEKVGSDDGLTGHDARDTFLVGLAGGRRVEWELPGARSRKTWDVRRNLESCSRREAVDGVGVRESQNGGRVTWVETGQVREEDGACSPCGDAAQGDMVTKELTFISGTERGPGTLTRTGS